MVTPYIVRAVAQKDLSRPDDGFAAAADPQADLLGSINRIYWRPRTHRTGQELSRHLRLYHGLRRDEDETMTARTPVDRKRAFRNAGALVGLAMTLGACMHTDNPGAPLSYSEDYRKRHPDRDPGSRPRHRYLCRPCAWRSFRLAARRCDGTGAALAAGGNRRDHSRYAGQHAQRTGGRGRTPRSSGSAHRGWRAGARARSFGIIIRMTHARWQRYG